MQIYFLDQKSGKELVKARTIIGSRINLDKNEIELQFDVFDMMSDMRESRLGVNN